MSVVNPFVAALFVAAPVMAQGVYLNADSPTSPTCPLVEIEKTKLERTSGAGATSVRLYQSGNQFFAKDQRKDVTGFAAYDNKAKGTTVASLKGKVVMVGLWSTHCEPSAKMLMEMASLYDKRAKFGFEILAVNMDRNQQEDNGAVGGWPAINQFIIRNPQFFKASGMQVYTPGLGKEGTSNFMDVVRSLPALFVIDREGNLASIALGYKDGFVGDALTRVVSERPPVAPAPASTPKP